MVPEYNKKKACKESVHCTSSTAESDLTADIRKPYAV
jgi:hypothetical protein